MLDVLRLMLLTTRPTVRVREIRATDGDKYRSILERTTVDDRYRRYFNHVDPFDPEFIALCVDERDDAVGLIAERWGYPLGVANAILLEGGRAELSIIVARDGRNKGLGRELLTRLIEDLRVRGFTELLAYSLGDNYEFERLARAVGMTPGACEAGVCSWHIRTTPLA